jgi:hypothetical protein
MTFKESSLIYFFYKSSRPTLGPTHPQIKRLHAATSQGVKRSGRKAGQSQHILQKLRMSGDAPPLRHMPPLSIVEIVKRR